MSITLASIVDKILPTLVVVVIVAVFGMYMRIGYLEQMATLSVARYNKDIDNVRAELKELQNKTTVNREGVIRLEAKK